MSRIVSIAARRGLAALALLGLLGAAMLFTSTSAHAASPKFGFSRTVYVGSYDHNVYALNAFTGTKLWQFTTGGIVFSSPTLGA